MHIERINRNGTDEPTCGVGIEAQMYRTELWTQWEKERVRQIGKVGLICIHTIRCNS